MSPRGCHQEIHHHSMIYSGHARLRRHPRGRRQQKVEGCETFIVEGGHGSPFLDQKLCRVEVSSPGCQVQRGSAVRGLGLNGGSPVNKKRADIMISPTLRATWRGVSSSEFLALMSAPPLGSRVATRRTPLSAAGWRRDCSASSVPSPGAHPLPGAFLLAGTWEPAAPHGTPAASRLEAPVLPPAF